MVPSVRALQPGDAGAARALVEEQLSGSRYETRVLELLDAAIGDDDDECRAAVATAPDDQRVHGVVLFGTVAGAPGIVKIHALVAAEHMVARALVELTRHGCARSGGRMIVCELPDDRPFLVAARAMRELGAAEEGRVADFVSDGVDLLLLVWRSR